MSDLGNDVTLWASSFGHWSKKESINGSEAFKTEVLDNLKIVTLKTRPLYYKNDLKRILNMLYFANAFTRISKDFKQTPDIIIASYPSPFAAYSAYKLARKLKARFVLEIRDLWPQNWVERGAFSKYHPFVQVLYRLEKYLYRNSDIIVTALPYVSEYLSERGIERNNVFWIPNAADLTDAASGGVSQPLDDESENIRGLMNENAKKNILNIVYVGGLGPANKVDTILEAAKILRDRNIKNVFFTVVGSGHSRENLIQYVKGNNIQSVRIWPAVSGSSVPGILKCADIGVLCLHDNPIYRYGVNLHKIYDYASAGLPIVFAAKVRNDLVALAKAGMTVPPGDPEAIAQSLLTLQAMDKEKRTAIGRRGYKYIAEHYDLSVLSKKYLDIISSN